MSKLASPLLLVMVFLMFGAARAAGQAGEQTKDVSVSVLLGADPVMVGQFNREDVSRSGLGTRTLRLLPHSVNEVYRRPLSVGVEVDYAYRPGAEVIARVTFTSARSKGTLQFSEFIDTRFPPFRATSFASFSDYRAWAFEGGHRWGGRNGKRVSPYFGWLAGVTVIEPISTGAGDLGEPAVFYRRTTTPTASASVGVMFRATRSAAIGIESGLRYQPNSGLPDRGRSVPAITRKALSGQRLSVPVTGVLRFDF